MSPLNRPIFSDLGKMTELWQVSAPSVVAHLSSVSISGLFYETVTLRPLGCRQLDRECIGVSGGGETENESDSVVISGVPIVAAVCSQSLLSLHRSSSSWELLSFKSHPETGMLKLQLASRRVLTAVVIRLLGYKRVASIHSPFFLLVTEMNLSIFPLRLLAIQLFYSWDR